jgi:hypothetical protein
MAQASSSSSPCIPVVVSVEEALVQLRRGRAVVLRTGHAEMLSPSLVHLMDACATAYVGALEEALDVRLSPACAAALGRSLTSKISAKGIVSGNGIMAHPEVDRVGRFLAREGGEFAQLLGALGLDMGGVALRCSRDALIRAASSFSPQPWPHVDLPRRDAGDVAIQALLMLAAADPRHVPHTSFLQLRDESAMEDSSRRVAELLLVEPSSPRGHHRRLPADHAYLCDPAYAWFGVPATEAGDLVLWPESVVHHSVPALERPVRGGEEVYRTCLAMTVLGVRVEEVAEFDRQLAACLALGGSTTHAAPLPLLNRNGNPRFGGTGVNQMGGSASYVSLLARHEPAMGAEAAGRLATAMCEATKKVHFRFDGSDRVVCVLHRTKRALASEEASEM